MGPMGVIGVTILSVAEDVEAGESKETRVHLHLMRVEDAVPSITYFFFLLNKDNPYDLRKTRQGLPLLIVTLP